MEIFIQSCHASLEYDHCRTFTDLGYNVKGNFDIGSKQRAKLPGISDINSDINDHNLIILHQVPNYVDVMRDLLTHEKTVILIGFGQSDTWQYQAIAELCRNYLQGYVAAYSAKDYRLYIYHGCPPHKVRLIRFGKYLNEFDTWQGFSSEPYVYLTCNSIHRRGSGCGWPILDRIRSQIPNLIISGKDTQEIGGLGEVSEEKMKDLYKNARCFLSFGTVPAALVMTQIEAWAAGCPTVCYDNGSGLREECLDLILTGNTDELVKEIKHLIDDHFYGNLWHLASLKNASRFDMKIILEEWKSFLGQIKGNNENFH